MNRTSFSMPKLFALSGALALALSSAATAQTADPQNAIRHAPDVRLVTTAKGAVINQAALDAISAYSMTMPAGPHKLTEGVWQLVGRSMNAPVVIEGKDGLIVWDTGESKEDGRIFLEDIRKISSKPVKTIIYSHGHYTGGAEALANGAEVQVIGHSKLNNNRKTGGSSITFGELLPLQMVRTLGQFHSFLPKDGPDSPVNAALYPSTDLSRFLPVTQPVEEGQELLVDGVRMQFFTQSASDADDSIQIWLPEQKLALSNHVWPMVPNIYTPRGAKFRDPREWAAGIRQLRDLQPEIVASTHAKPLTGKAQIQETLGSYMDGLQFIMDQTLRGTLKGLGPDELREFVKLPPALAANPLLSQSYGEVSWYGPYIYQHALGWFDGDAASLNPLPLDIQARKIVDGFGGRDAVLAQANKAMQASEHAWALQLSNYLYRLDPQDAQARAVKANAMRALGQSTTAALTRSMYLTQARALEGQLKLPLQILPTLAQIKASDPGMWINYQRVRLDPVKAQGVDQLLRYEFTEPGLKPYALHVRRGVAEFISNPDALARKADITVTMDRETLARLYRGETDISQAIDSGKVRLSQGTKPQAQQFFALFDAFDPQSNLLIKPLAEAKLKP